MHGKCCGNCLYHFVAGKISSCRRMPPAIDPRNKETTSGVFPTVWSHAWCGEWSPKDNEVEPIPIDSCCKTLEVNEKDEGKVILVRNKETSPWRAHILKRFTPNGPEGCFYCTALNNWWRFARRCRLNDLNIALNEGATENE